MKKIAIYPGSFDPMTIGHLDILKRSLSLFDEVIVLIAVNNRKKSRFSVEKRLEMIKEITKNMPNVKVDFTDGLTIDYARKVNAEKCISCMRCVKICPQQAKALDPAGLTKVAAMLEKVCSDRKTCELY